MKAKKSIWVAAILSILAAPGVSAAIGNSIAQGFLNINNFFVNQRYLAYIKVIDFMFFFALFFAIYYLVVPYAFKQKSRPVSFIAFILALMTAFLFVMGGYSVKKLIPFIPWLIFLLLFIFFWKLLESLGMQNKLWRFLLAALLTVLVLYLLGKLLFPGAQFPSFFDGIGRIDIPSISAPGSGFTPPSYGPGSGYGPGTGSIVPTPSPGGGSLLTGSWSWLLWILVPIILTLLIMWGARRWRGRNQRSAEELRQIIAQMGAVFNQYQALVPQYIHALNAIIQAYRTHRDLAHPDVAAAGAHAQQLRVQLAGLENRINALMMQIVAHRGFPHLTPAERADLVTLSVAIYRAFSYVTDSMLLAVGQLMGRPDDAGGIPFP